MDHFLARTTIPEDCPRHGPGTSWSQVRWSNRIPRSPAACHRTGNGCGVMHGTCQAGMPTGVHAALSILRVLAGKEPKPFRFGYYHTPVSLGRNDAVVQFTRPDDSPRSIVLTGKWAEKYKETVTAAPWPTFARMKKMPASGALWPHGGRYTRIRSAT